MSAAEAPVTRREFDDKMLADLREWRNAPRVKRLLDAAALDRTVSLTLEEFDALLRIADERDALRVERDVREGHPDDHPIPRPAVTVHLAGTDTLPAGHMIVGGEVLPLPREDAPPYAPDLCDWCNTPIRMLGGHWLHLHPEHAGRHPATKKRNA